MSYGWLTESSLIPKPGKPIENVSAKSLAGLKALMIEKQEESKKHKLETGTTFRKPTKKFRTRLESRLIESNDGVNERNMKDMKASMDSMKSHESVKKKLEEKAKYYDALTSGKMDPNDIATQLSSNVNIKNAESIFNLDVKNIVHSLDANIPNVTSTYDSNSSKLSKKEDLKERLALLKKKAAEAKKIKNDVTESIAPGTTDN